MDQSAVGDESEQRVRVAGRKRRHGSRRRSMPHRRDGKREEQREHTDGAEADVSADGVDDDSAQVGPAPPLCADTAPAPAAPFVSATSAPPSVSQRLKSAVAAACRKHHVPMAYAQRETNYVSLVVKAGDTKAFAVGYDVGQELEIDVVATAWSDRATSGVRMTPSTLAYRGD